eukprot:1637042-Rhodomonas_salina.1
MPRRGNRREIDLHETEGEEEIEEAANSDDNEFLDDRNASDLSVASKGEGEEGENEQQDIEIGQSVWYEQRNGVSIWVPVID